MRGGRARGWLFSPHDSVTPVLLVDGRPARLLRWPVHRPDLRGAARLGHRIGFSFEVDGVDAGASLQLYVLSEMSLELVHETSAGHRSVALDPLCQLERAHALSQDPSCLAITVWDGSHNPVGRAKVLYDVARTRGPAVVFAYQFEEFGAGLWQPLVGADVDLVLIPWTEREHYHRLIADLDLSFSTVWLCKPRLPTFMLAAQVADEDARLVLDLDDNEEHFSSSPVSRRKVYGLPGLARVRQLAADVPARTVASRSLQEDFGGELVRHVRTAGPAASAPASSPAAPEEATVAFVGTVRPHKGVVAAARAVAMVSWARKRRIRFHVFGDIAPASLKDELLAVGAVVGGIVPVDRLPRRLADIDCLIAGYPDDQAADAPIVRYQISAKIGDALALGKPVLVPDTPSVRDLADVPGVHLFDEAGFADQLCAALDSREQISLPPDFTATGAAEALSRALTKAEATPRAGEVLHLLRDVFAVESTPRTQREVLLLVWKQHDAGVYGRRIDQVARAYKRAHPAADVVVLELLQDEHRRRYADQAGDYTSDAALVGSLFAAKAGNGHQDPDGVTYCQVQHHDDRDAAAALHGFLVRNAMLPGNTRVVLFPVVPGYDGFAHVLARYPTVADVVDNQFSWSRSASRRRGYAWQYAVMARSADRVVFNSEANRQEFVAQRAVAEDDPRVAVVPNWYLPPRATRPAEHPTGTGHHPTMIYTGNMNDRVDWTLLSELVARVRDSRLVLIGAAARVGDSFDQLVTRPNVAYLGPLSETDTLRMLRVADVAVVPHLVDDVSAYMNPLKLKQYDAIGLPAVVTDVPGVGPAHRLLVRSTREGFVADVERVLADRSSSAVQRCTSTSMPPEAAEYLALLDALPLPARSRS